jgi:hypothetical protein
VLRGGSWNNNGRNCRSANRNANHPDERNDNIGFRLARAQAGQVHQQAQRRGLSVVGVSSPWQSPRGPVR